MGLFVLKPMLLMALAAQAHPQFSGGYGVPGFMAPAMQGFGGYPSKSGGSGGYQNQNQGFQSMGQFQNSQNFQNQGFGGYQNQFGNNQNPQSFQNQAQGGYQSPSFSQSETSGSTSGSSAQDSSEGGKTFRYVSVHVAPADPEDEKDRVIRIPGSPDKHVNIIFVKAPSSSSSQKTEVILPGQDEHKSLVYVLVKKEDFGANLKVSKPEPKKPAKPQVYFIKYKDAEGPTAGQQSQQGGNFANFPTQSGPGQTSQAYGVPA